ncbi:MAG: DUF2934 domain-containing protein [Nitrospira sp.]|nr:DUF2934 domain-containing protein [Nitrospira sp.]
MARPQKTTTSSATTTKRLTTHDMTSSSPTQQERQDTNGLQGTIAARAYALYEERGYRHGDDLQDWVDAEREILSRQSLA